MQGLLSSLNFEHDACRQLAVVMLRLLVSESSLNEYLERVMPRIAGLFGTTRISLVDYREKSAHFELLHFEGYPDHSVHQLRRRIDEMNVTQALTERRPYWSDRNSDFLCLPLYFSNVLEAVLALEGEGRIELTPERTEAAELTARFLGLLMSSTRLKINRDQVVDLEDLHRARQIQLSFLPSRAPSSGRWELHGHNDSSSLVGGDYFDFFPSSGGTLHGVLADACGHGMAAALIMSNFRGLLQTEIRRRADISEMFNLLNQSVHFEADVIQYLTGVLFRFLEEDGRLEYLNAGHFEPVLVTKDGEIRTLPGGGPPLGMFKESCYPLGETRLRAGDLVVLFTDGLVDIENRQGEYFGVERILQALRDLRGFPLQEVSFEVLSRARAFADGQRFEDDVTLFLFRFHG